SIRFYVSAEGLAVLVLYLALWFWIGLLLDYGFFKVFTLDLVQELPRWFRGGVLAVLTAGLLAVVVLIMVLRLFREFHDPALAMVLDRRFPKLLSVRLITAVELAAPGLAVAYGYSQAMVDQTIRDAAERVDQLEIKEVFDWKRLRRLGAILAGLTVGLYVLVAAGYCAFNLTGQVGQFVWRFNDVPAIWVERELLFVGPVWPPAAPLEL